MILDTSIDWTMSSSLATSIATNFSAQVILQLSDWIRFGIFFKQELNSWLFEAHTHTHMKLSRSGTTFVSLNLINITDKLTMD